MARPRRLRRALIGTAAFGLLTLAVRVSRDPIDTGIALQRATYRLTGFARHTVAAPAGPLVAFVGGRHDSTAPTVVLVHGLGDQAGTWFRVAPRLRRLARVVAFDLPGHGESAPAEGPLDLRQARDALARIVDAVSPARPVTLVGNSLGGWLALLAARDRPTRVHALLLVAPAGLRMDPPHLLLARTRTEADALVHALHGPHAPPLPGFVLDDLVDHIAAGATPRLLPRLLDADFLDRELGRITTPTVLLWGTADTIVPLALGERMARELPGARLLRLRRRGHAPHHDTPEAVVAALRPLLASR